jgi:hypothetical protein
MRTLLRNFFYAAGLVLIACLYTSNPDDLQLRDLARLVQSNTVQQLTFLLTLVLTALEFMFGFTYTRARPPFGVAFSKGSAPFAEAIAGGASKECPPLKC